MMTLVFPPGMADRSVTATLAVEHKLVLHGEHGEDNLYIIHASDVADLKHSTQFDVLVIHFHSEARPVKLLDSTQALYASYYATWQNYLITHRPDYDLPT